MNGDIDPIQEHGLRVENVRENMPKLEVPSFNLADVKFPEGKFGDILRQARVWIPTLLILLIIGYVGIRILS